MSKKIEDIAKEIIDFTSHTRLYPIYQVEKIENILKKYFYEVDKK